MGDAEEATTAAMKLRDATRKLSDKCGEGHDQNVLDLFEQVKTMVLIMKGINGPAMIVARSKCSLQKMLSETQVQSSKDHCRRLVVAS